MSNSKKLFLLVGFFSILATMLFLSINLQNPFLPNEFKEDKESREVRIDSNTFSQKVIGGQSKILNIEALQRHSLPSQLYFDDKTSSWSFKYDLEPESFLWTIIYGELASRSSHRRTFKDQEVNLKEAYKLVRRLWKSFESKDSDYSYDTLFLLPYIYELNQSGLIHKEFQTRAFKLVREFEDYPDLSDHPLGGTERFYYKIRALNSLNQYFLSISLSPSKDLIQIIDTIKSFAKEVPHKNNATTSLENNDHKESVESNEKELILFCAHLWANAPLLKIINDEEKETFKSIYSKSMTTFEARIKDRNNGFKELHSVLMCLDAFIDAERYLGIPFKRTFEATISGFINDTWSFANDERCPDKHGFYSTREENTDCRKRKMILRDNVWIDYLIYKMAVNSVMHKIIFAKSTTTPIDCSCASDINRSNVPGINCNLPVCDVSEDPRCLPCGDQFTCPAECFL